MREKLGEMNDKLKEIEININAFIALYDFRAKNDYRPTSTMTSESSRKMKKVSKNINLLKGLIFLF